MFGLFIDFLLGMVGTQMAFAAVFRLSGHGGPERMLGVAGNTDTFGAVRVDSADAGVGPGVVVQLGRIGFAAQNLAVFVALQRQHRTVALPAAAGHVGLVGGHTADHFGQHVVQRGHDLTRRWHDGTVPICLASGS